LFFFKKKRSNPKKRRRRRKKKKISPQVLDQQRYSVKWKGTSTQEMEELQEE